MECGGSLTKADVTGKIKMPANHPRSSMLQKSEAAHGREYADELLDLVHAPLTIVTLADGWVLMRKAGMVGIGTTPYEAATDLLSKLRVAITRPKWRA